MLKVETILLKIVKIALFYFILFRCERLLPGECLQDSCEFGVFVDRPKSGSNLVDIETEIVSVSRFRRERYRVVVNIHHDLTMNGCGHIQELLVTDLFKELFNQFILQTFDLRLRLCVLREALFLDGADCVENFDELFDAGFCHVREDLKFSDVVVLF